MSSVSESFFMFSKMLHGVLRRQTVRHCKRYCVGSVVWVLRCPSLGLSWSLFVPLYRLIVTARASAISFSLHRLALVMNFEV